MKFRHELKHQISNLDLIVLRSRLSQIAKLDENAINGSYNIKSLYFDNIEDKALNEKVSGLNIRTKYRLRYYNNDTTNIKLERKGKVNSLCSKDQTLLTTEQVKLLLCHKYDWMVQSDNQLIQELYIQIKNYGLEPKSIVEYTREPYIYAPGNVRVTLDYNIKTALKSIDFLNPDYIAIPVIGNPIILEVKWDEYLPDIIKDII